MSTFNATSLELSSTEMNVLQVAIDHMAEHLTDLLYVDSSDREVLRRLDATKRLQTWFS